jgi:serine/threonine protein phosphatase PrpC
MPCHVRVVADRFGNPAGDSHAFLIDSYGSAKRLSTPHDLTNEDEVARVVSAGGHIVIQPNRKPRLYNKPRPYFGDVGALVTRSVKDLWL